ncbi:DNA mismatch repair protein MutS [Ancylomarina sp. 16SWW S1-10-2]|uniref:MutS-related protein n=1 Tax=Ancylomarina sp. 16SWW S1-10-2 TaxID=2499681 RepID=UPI0012AE86CD|nr:DNA mismatch repair protein MutS [Ancylomarina sp. 16SWW S1-10-2]MRT92460.1 DNA mismatch repair protein MutS [Ancylomarina sp. 16SWW S1-10-2]
MLFGRRRKYNEAFLNSFGKIKDDVFSFDLIESYFKNKKNESSFQVLSDKTCQDLDFDELFMFLDRTQSKVGQQYLYNKLRCIPSDQDQLKRNESLIETFRENTDLRLKTQKQLDRLSANGCGYISSLFQEEYIKPPKWFFLIPLLSYTSLFSLLLIPFNRNLFFVFLGVVIINLGIHYWNKKNLYYNLLSIPALLELSNTAKILFEEDCFKNINPKLKLSTDVIDKLRFKMKFFKIGSDTASEFEAAMWMIIELVNIMFLLEPIFLFSILKQFDTKRAELESVFTFVGEIDSLISVASLREGTASYCIPNITESNSIMLVEELYHPLITNAVPNSIRVKDKSILLTGSNMSGKTTFIRTIGVNVLTGLTLNTCFGKSFSLPRMRIFSAIRISDDLMNDRSYYFEEVLTIKEMIEESQSENTNLFLLDEIFKGTNTIERISAGKAVLSSIAKGNNIVFVSTHDIELADLLQDEYELYHFSEIVGHKTVDFDYKLKSGKLKNRNAIKILQINGYPESVIQEANSLALEMDTSLALNI